MLCLYLYKQRSSVKCLLIEAFWLKVCHYTDEKIVSVNTGSFSLKLVRSLFYSNCRPMGEEESRWSFARIHRPWWYRYQWGSNLHRSCQSQRQSIACQGNTKREKGLCHMGWRGVRKGLCGIFDGTSIWYSWVCIVNSFIISAYSVVGWVPGTKGKTPGHAFCVGKTIEGEELYVGRAPWDGSLTPGRIHPSHECLYIAYGGSEVKLRDYEVLVKI